MPNNQQEPADSPNSEANAKEPQPIESELTVTVNAEDPWFQHIKPVQPPVAAVEMPAKDSMVGNYRLLQKIGEGGMGTVWMASQSVPVQRKVAVKLIRADLVSSDTVARFEQERQALALMEHPNIAKVLDAGTTPAGIPYFVMEWVNGISVTEYCDRHRVPIHGRLRIFETVCRAVQHAHTKGIMHRDLKPANILVAEIDSEPVPKIIDFGLAKAVDHQRRLTDKTMFTEFGKVVGTLQYMSPEQAELKSPDIDARTDVYSLGVILYELLTGTTPIQREQIAKEGMLQILNVIREHEPQRPSARLSSIRESKTAIGSHQPSEPRRLQSMLKGELDWVVLKALAKERKRRYETAAAFADDIDRFLQNMPVSARPPSSFYAVGKFVRRNRAATTLSAVTLILACVGFLFVARAWQQTSLLAKELEAANKVSVAFINELSQNIDQKLVGSDFSLAPDSFRFGEAEPELKAKLANIHMSLRIGFYLMNLGANHEAAAEWFQQGITGLEALDAEGLLADDLIPVYSLAVSNYGYLVNVTEGTESANRWYEREVQLAERYCVVKKNSRSSQVNLATAYLNASIHVGTVERATRGLEVLDQLGPLEANEQILKVKLLINRFDEALQGRYDLTAALKDSQQAYKIAVNHNFELPRILSFLITAHSALGNLTEANEYAALLDQQVERGAPATAASRNSKQTAATTYFNFGVQQQLAGQFEEALTWYNKATELLAEIREHAIEIISNQLYVNAHWNQAEALMAMGQTEHAIASWDLAIESAPWVKDNKIPQLRSLFELRRLICLAKRDAKGTIDRLEQNAALLKWAQQPHHEPLRGDTLLTLANLYAVAVSATSDDALRQTWTDKSLDYLLELQAAGLWGAELSKEIAQDADFGPIFREPRANVLRNQEEQ